MEADDAITVVGAAVALASKDWIGAAVDGTSVIASAVRNRFPSGTERMLRAVQEELEDGVLRRLPVLEAQVEKLKQNLKGPPSAVSIVTTLENFTHSYTRAEGNKRDVVLNALVNAFDPELYRRSMTQRLFSIMDKLTYGDLDYLTKLAEGRAFTKQPWTMPDTLDALHASEIVENRLAYTEELSQHRREDVIHITELGRWMVRLIRDPASKSSGTVP